MDKIVIYRNQPIIENKADRDKIFMGELTKLIRKEARREISWATTEDAKYYLRAMIRTFTEIFKTDKIIQITNFGILGSNVRNTYTKYESTEEYIDEDGYKHKVSKPVEVMATRVPIYEPSGALVKKLRIKEEK